MSPKISNMATAIRPATKSHSRAESHIKNVSEALCSAGYGNACGGIPCEIGIDEGWSEDFEKKLYAIREENVFLPMGRL